LIEFLHGIPNTTYIDPSWSDDNSCGIFCLQKHNIPSIVSSPKGM
jgi:hypothetical protein